jgi:protein SCO1/2
MKGFVKFLVLAAAGFGLGAGAAWLQSPHGNSMTPPQFPAEKVSKPSPEASPISETPKADTAKEEAPKAETPVANTTAQETAPKETLVPETPAAKTEDLTSPDDKVAKPDKDIQPAPPVTAKVDVSPEVMKNLAAAKGDVPTPDAGVGGAFSLTDDNEQPVTEKSWPGKYLLVFFGFTNCPDVCPVTLDKITSALDQLADDAPKVQPLFITIDAARDKPKALKEYVSHFHKSILGLTGTDVQLKAVQDAYKVYSSRRDQPNGHDYSFDHSAFVYFMAPDGKLAEVIKTEDKASDIADRLRPYLEGKKQPESPTP